MQEFDPYLRAMKQPDGMSAEAVSSETTSELLVPSISIDRALSHFAGHMEVDARAIHDFYYALPHADKLPLDKLHIHFSATRSVDNLVQAVTHGDFCPKGTRFLNSKMEQRVTPELEVTDRPTIRVYVGSAMPELLPDNEIFRRTDREIISALVSESLSEALAHELTHYAQTSPEDLTHNTFSDRVKHKSQHTVDKLVLAAFRNKSDLVVGAGVFGIAEVASDGQARSVVTALGAASLSFLMNRKRRIVKQAESMFQRYTQREEEADAREHEETSVKLCSVSLLDVREFPAGYKLEDFIKPEESRLELYLASDRHKNLSFTPRGSDPRQVRKDSNRSELRAIGIRSRARRARLKSNSAPAQNS